MPTTYRGTNFRSRLEARWAAFFDLVGWHWVYEVGEGDHYIPDFLISGRWPLFVEVGPCIALADYIEKRQKPNRSAVQLGQDVLVLGVNPLAWHEVSYHEHVVAGLLGELTNDPDEGVYLDWSAGLWGRCYECRSVGVVHDTLTYCLRPCGHHQGGGFGERIDAAELEALWRRAGNDTQWQPEAVGAIMRRLGR